MYITHWYQAHIQQRELEVGQQIQSAQSELAQELDVAISNPGSALLTSGADGASRDGNHVGEGGPWMVKHVPRQQKGSWHQQPTTPLSLSWISRNHKQRVCKSLSLQHSLHPNGIRGYIRMAHIPRLGVKRRHKDQQV